MRVLNRNLQIVKKKLSALGLGRVINNPRIGYGLSNRVRKKITWLKFVTGLNFAPAPWPQRYVEWFQSDCSHSLFNII